jgi:phosphatidylserine/phosphatidylglycerophosphate/cardiolipin synthase-like enzyme
MSLLDSIAKNLLQVGANIYALIDLHTKLYIFDSHSTIIGSANFTHGGFVSNHELSILLNNESEITDRSTDYFYDLLNRIIQVGEGVVEQEWIEKEKDAIRVTGPNRKSKEVSYSNEFK